MTKNTQNPHTNFGDRIRSGAFACINVYEEEGFWAADEAKAVIVKKIRTDFPGKTNFDVEDALDAKIEETV